jgi:hypothetical protein
MSTYLLLRNNKESGPYTIEELKGMTLKSYDLIWIVGKTAAWRYPGEIPEFKSFAPTIPEQEASQHLIKSNTEVQSSETSQILKSEQPNAKPREFNTPRFSPDRSVYVNHPADRTQSAVSTAGLLYDANLQSDFETDYNFPELYKRKQSESISFSGKLVWIGTIILLFATGIVTGLMISDRRKIFTSDANLPQKNPAINKTVTNASENTEGQKINNQKITDPDQSVKPAASETGKSMSGTGKKRTKAATARKDSVAAFPVTANNAFSDSSLKQNTNSKTEVLYQKIRENPENFVNVITGQYSKGLFGGISSIPITVTNNSPVMMDLVVVNIEYIQSNNKVFKTENVSFNDLEPGESVTERAPKSPRGVKINTRIHLISSRKLELSYSH